MRTRGCARAWVCLLVGAPADSFFESGVGGEGQADPHSNTRQHSNTVIQRRSTLMNLFMRLWHQQVRPNMKAAASRFNLF